MNKRGFSVINQEVRNKEEKYRTYKTIPFFGNGEFGPT
jgi:hypothetical protein